MAVAVLIGAGGWAYYDHQQTVQAQIAAEAKKQQRKVNELKKTLATFYYDGAHQFLRTSMINQDLTKLKTSLNEVKGEKGYADLEKTYEDIQTKVKDIKGVNELFTTEAIIDDHLADDLKLKADQEIKRFATDDSDFGQLLKKRKMKLRHNTINCKQRKRKPISFSLMIKSQTLQLVSNIQMHKRL